MALGDNRTAALKTTAYELVKQYLTYDGLGRCTAVYTAHTDAVTGTPCTLTEYAYDGTTGRVTKRKESESAWNATWDI